MFLIPVLDGDAVMHVSMQII